MNQREGAALGKKFIVGDTTTLEMLLHVWGSDGAISVIEPECLAAAWLLLGVDTRLQVITSNNTNLSPTHTLPLMINDAGEEFCGYPQIYKAVRGKPLDLIEYSLICYITEKLRPINQYNLYIKTDNYEKFTRRLFKHYFPFPMMYNQPLKFYYNAQELAQTVGLNTDKRGFLLFGSTETETINEDTEEAEPVAISSLHEQQLIRKLKQKQSLLETRYTLKCLTLILQYLDIIQEFYTDNERDLAGADLILWAYLQLLTLESLPDPFVASHLEANHPDTLQHFKTEAKRLNEALTTAAFRKPIGAEAPSLWNEIIHTSRPLFDWLNGARHG